MKTILHYIYITTTNSSKTMFEMACMHFWASHNPDCPQDSSFHLVFHFSFTLWLTSCGKQFPIPKTSFIQLSRFWPVSFFSRNATTDSVLFHTCMIKTHVSLSGNTIVDNILFFLKNCRPTLRLFFVFLDALALPASAELLSKWASLN